MEPLRAPVYSKFKPEWRDELGREYAVIREGFMAVRLPIAKNKNHTMEMPLPGQKLLLTEVGGGNTLCLEVISLSMSRGRTATAWFEYKKC